MTRDGSSLRPGTRVRLYSTGEVGVVVASWHSEEVDAEDCYVAFFGPSFPDGQPVRIPYVLRYLAASLEVVD